MIHSKYLQLAIVALVLNTSATAQNIQYAILVDGSISNPDHIETLDALTVFEEFKADIN